MLITKRQKKYCVHVAVNRRKKTRNRFVCVSECFVILPWPSLWFFFFVFRGLAKNRANFARVIVSTKNDVEINGSKPTFFFFLKPNRNAFVFFVLCLCKQHKIHAFGLQNAFLFVCKTQLNNNNNNRKK